MNQDSLNEAMILNQQEQSQEQKQQQSTPDCLHDFEYSSSYGEIVNLNCGVIDSSPMLMVLPDYLYYRPGSKPDKTAYLKKCIAEHEEQYNCFIPCDVYKAFKHFQGWFNRIFPNEKKCEIYSLLYSPALWLSMPRSSFS